MTFNYTIVCFINFICFFKWVM